MTEDLRVHIIPLGYDDMRVIWPLIEKKVDRVYVIRHITDNKEKLDKYYNWIKKQLAKELPQIEIYDSVADLWNLHELIEIIRKIIRDERKRGNIVYVNVSTGPKVAAIAGMLACMICNSISYYVRLDYSKKKKIDNLTVHPVIDWIDPPVFHIKQPTKTQMITLTLLDLKGPLRKTELIEELVKMKIIKPENDDWENFSVHAKHGQLQSLLRPLKEEWGYIEVEMRSRRSDISLTKNGRNALLMFGFDKF